MFLVMGPIEQQRSRVEKLLSMELASGEQDWQITPHGRFLGEVLAERDLVSGKEVLELGGGQGNHTIVMARQRPARLVVTEIAGELLETTRANVERNVEAAGMVEYRVADWLDTEGPFDVVVTNPPFAKSGKQNRRYFIDSLILDAHKRLKPEGELVFVQSSMADVAKTLRMLDENGFEVRDGKHYETLFVVRARLRPWTPPAGAHAV
jgi:16S rRNA G1207 methylase RsmC